MYGIFHLAIIVQCMAMYHAIAHKSRRVLFWRRILQRMQNILYSSTIKEHGTRIGMDVMWMVQTTNVTSGWGSFSSSTLILTASPQILVWTQQTKFGSSWYVMWMVQTRNLSRGWGSFSCFTLILTASSQMLVWTQQTKFGSNVYSTQMDTWSDSPVDAMCSTQLGWAWCLSSVLYPALNSLAYLVHFQELVGVVTFFYFYA